MKNEPFLEHSIYYFDDPLFVCDGYSGAGWYFWDIDSLIGPFATEKKAKVALYFFMYKI